MHLKALYGSVILPAFRCPRGPNTRPDLGPENAHVGLPQAVVDSNIQLVLGPLLRDNLGGAPTLSEVQSLADVLLPPTRIHPEFN